MDIDKKLEKALRALQDKAIDTAAYISQCCNFGDIDGESWEYVETLETHLYGALKKLHVEYERAIEKEEAEFKKKYGSDNV